MDNKLFMCSFLSNSNYMNPSASYVDENFYITVKDVDFRAHGQFFHTHTFFEFDLVLTGKGINRSRDGEAVVTAGDIIFGTPASIHCIFPIEGEPFTVANIAFKGKFEKAVVEAFDTLESFILKLSEEDFEFVCSELYGVIESKISEEKKKMFVSGVVQKLLAVVSDAYMKSNIAKREESMDSKVLMAIIYIMKNYNKPIKIGDVAKHVGYSPDYLGNLIKKTTRMTFSSYLITLRLENAYHLLMEKDKTIQEICMEVGYSSYPNFYYAFKKRFGITPGEVTKRSRRENTEDYAKKGGIIPLKYDENGKVIWR